ncbi:hypothetical protein V1525DRAFT_397793 [Lipomyces kononenkoae]|uniref:Uncharacterized protein n=1 Tax=Lipomyces kononenkoae TaxID=34357 RepID=A0ACC3T6I9_LIPKO
MSDDATKVEPVVAEAPPGQDAPAANAPETSSNHAPEPSAESADAPVDTKEGAATESGETAEKPEQEEESKAEEPVAKESVSEKPAIEESKSEQPPTEKPVTEETTVVPEDKKEAAAEPEPVEKVSKKKSASTPIKASYLPGAVVLAKLKGFPPWPAMILADAFLPPHILKLKPKASTGTPGSARMKRKGTSVEEEDASLPSVFPVRFFNDDNYMWASRSDLKPLSGDQAQKYVDTVSSKPSKKDKSLVVAYKIAVNPPSLEEFAHGNSVHPSEEEEEEDVEMEEVEEEESVPEKKSKKRKSIAKGDEDVATPPTKKKKRESKANGSAKKANGDIAKEKKTPKKTPSSGKKASAAALRESLEERTKQVLYVRHKLQKAFLTRDKPPAEEEMDTMDKFFTKLENFQGLEISIIRNTKINKVLKGIHKLNEIPLDDKYNFRERSRKMLEIWTHMFEGISSPVPAETSPKPAEILNVTETGEASIDQPAEQPAEITV